MRWMGKAKHAYTRTSQIDVEREREGQTWRWNKYSRKERGTKPKAILRDYKDATQTKRERKERERKERGRKNEEEGMYKTY